MTENELIKLKDRVIDPYGNVLYFSDSLLELLYMGINSKNILFSEKDKDVLLYNKYSVDEKYELPKYIESNLKRKEKWFYPDEYEQINLLDYFNNILNQKGWSEERQKRIIEEIKLYEKKDLIKFLRFCIYLSDVIKNNDIITGTGRGSSCASFLLFLLEIHLVDSVKYNIDINEFLK